MVRLTLSITSDRPRSRANFKNKLSNYLDTEKLESTLATVTILPSDTVQTVYSVIEKNINNCSHNSKLSKQNGQLQSITKEVANLIQERHLLKHKKNKRKKKIKLSKL